MNLPYSQRMGKETTLLTLKLDTDEPIELSNFVGSFTSLANEFERFIAHEYPDAKSDPKMFVREVRNGCIEADLFTGLSLLAGVITHMDQMLIVEQFVKRWGVRFKMLLDGNAPSDELNSSRELKDWADAVSSIASDPTASHRLEAAHFENGKRDIRASFKFTSLDARTAQSNIDDRIKLITAPKVETHHRVLMIMTRSDVSDAAINKKSGERVLISQLDDKSRGLMFGSELAEQEIRSHVREADENVYKKGFVVDVAVHRNPSNDKINAYQVMNFHSVIDIEDD